jgi:hypothetical protein
MECASTKDTFRGCAGEEDGDEGELLQCQLGIENLVWCVCGRSISSSMSINGGYIHASDCGEELVVLETDVWMRSLVRVSQLFFDTPCTPASMRKMFLR